MKQNKRERKSERGEGAKGRGKKEKKENGWKRNSNESGKPVNIKCRKNTKKVQKVLAISGQLRKYIFQEIAELFSSSLYD